MHIRCTHRDTAEKHKQNQTKIEGRDYNPSKYDKKLNEMLNRNCNS